MFSVSQFLFSAAVGTVASLVLIGVYRRVVKESRLAWGQAVILALVVGVSIVLWRAAGNTPSLNEDPIPPVSPNDVLCPVMTYVGLSLYAGFRGIDPGLDWMRLRALLTLVSLVVNVVTI